MNAEPFVRKAVIAGKLHKSSRECGEKTFYRLVVVKLHNSTAEFSGEIT